MPAPPTSAATAPALRTIVIVGAGFSGAVTAVQLLRHARHPLRVVLVNESGRMARGLAYGTRSEAHVLNVPAGNMSALADRPDDFLRYCRGSDPQVQPASFVPRRLYGAYLEALLSAAEARGDASAGLRRVVGRVVAIVPPGQPGATAAQVTLADGQVLQADTVVLAFGHFPPLEPAGGLLAGLPAARYLPDPWRAGVLESVAATDDVLLIGAGLTAVDVALALQGQGHRGRLLSISRRGLAPQSHRRSGVATSTVDGAALVRDMAGGLRQAVRALRRATAERLARGEDWRDVVGALRAHTPSIWQSWSMADRARFLRHVRPHWEVLRHRCAPDAHDAFTALQQQGRLELLAARLRGVQPVDDGLLVQLARRGGAATEQRRAQVVINCTGPSSDLLRSRSPLIESLLQQGLLSADALGQGLAVDAGYQVIDSRQQASPWLRYIGPLLKARDWEATAVPELRQHAQALARLLGSRID